MPEPKDYGNEGDREAQCVSRSAPDALDDHLLGAGLRVDLGLDLFAIVGGDLAAPGVGAVVLIDPAGGGVGHGGEWLCGCSLVVIHPDSGSVGVRTRLCERRTLMTLVGSRA